MAHLAQSPILFCQFQQPPMETQHNTHVQQTTTSMTSVHRKHLPVTTMGNGEMVQIHQAIQIGAKVAFNHF